MNDLYQPPDTQLTDAATPTEYAGFWIRLVAGLVDGIALTLITLPLSFAVFGWDMFVAHAERFSALDVAINYLLPVVLVLGFWRSKLATPGKLLVGVRIVDAETLARPTMGQLIGRYFGYMVSMLPLFLGCIWVAWDKRKQAFHDKLAGTVVVAATGPLPGPIPLRGRGAGGIGRIRQTLVPIVLGTCVIGLGLLAVRLFQGIGAPDLDTTRGFQHDTVSFRYPGNWRVAADRDRGDVHFLQLRTPGETQLLFLVTTDPTHLEGYGQRVVDSVAEHMSESETVGDVAILKMDLAAPEPVEALIGGRTVSGLEWHYTLRVLGIGDPGHAGYFPIRGTPQSLGIVYHGTKQDAQHLRAGLDYLFSTVQVAGR